MAMRLVPYRPGQPQDHAAAMPAAATTADLLHAESRRISRLVFGRRGRRHAPPARWRAPRCRRCCPAPAARPAAQAPARACRNRPRSPARATAARPGWCWPWPGSAARSGWWQDDVGERLGHAPLLERDHQLVGAGGQRQQQETAHHRQDTPRALAGEDQPLALQATAAPGARSACRPSRRGPGSGRPRRRTAGRS